MPGSVSQKEAPLRHNHFYTHCLFIPLQTYKIIVHSLHILRPVTVLIRIPGQGFPRKFQFPADTGKLFTSPLDILPFDLFFLTQDSCMSPVLVILRAISAFFILVPTADRL